RHAEEARNPREDVRREVREDLEVVSRRDPQGRDDRIPQTLMAKHPAKPLAVTMGEPAGIGPDITIAAWLRRRELNLPAFYLLGEQPALGRRAKALGADIRIVSVRTSEAEATFADALPVVATGETATATPGEPDESSAPAALASIRHAVADVREGRAGAVVTN